MKCIPLTNSDEVALVDNAGYRKLSKYRWFVVRLGPPSKKYPRIMRTGSSGEPGFVAMHRAIMEPPAGRRVTHIDGDYRNCRRDNLRVGPAPKAPKPPKQPTSPKPPKPRKEQKPEIAIDDCIRAIPVEQVQEWLRYCKRNCQETTVRQYSVVLRRFTAHHENKPLALITVADLEAYLDAMLDGRGRNTVNHHLKALKSFWTWQARRHGTANIAAEVPLLPEDDPEQRFLTEDEYTAVLNACKRPIEHDMIQLYGNTGLRREEMRMLRWRYVAADLRALRVPHGKGNKARTVPLNAVCSDILERNRRDDTFAFLLRWRCRSSHNALCRRLAGRASIVAFGPHALRHYFATRLIRQGVPLKIVSMILGHASTKITEQIYVHLCPTDLIGVTDILTK